MCMLYVVKPHPTNSNSITVFKTREILKEWFYPCHPHLREFPLLSMSLRGKHADGNTQGDQPRQRYSKD